MQDSKESSKNSFIESLIKYKKHFGQTFPILALKNNSQEDIILKIEDAIKNNVMFRTNNIVVKKTNNSSSKLSYKELIYKIKKSMSDVGYDYNIIINEYNDYVNLRKQSHIFSFKEHLRGLILSQLYNDRWGDNNIRKYIDIIRIIFKDYDKDLLKEADIEEIYNKLYNIHCTNPSTKRVLAGLKKNIETFELIEKDYGSLDNFVCSEEIYKVVDKLYEGKYKLIQVGPSTAYDYLLRVGIETSKLTTSIERLFGSNRLGLVERSKATKRETISIIIDIAKEVGLSETEIYNILWQFCIKSGANICTPIPNCDYCQLKNICKYDKD